MIKCKLTNKEFKSNKSFVIHIKKIYGDSLTAYIKYNNIDIKESKCYYCGKDKEFIGFTNGFRKTCGSKECKKIFYSEEANKRCNKSVDIDNIIDYVNHILENIEEYRNKIITNYRFKDMFIKKNVPYRKGDNVLEYLKKVTLNNKSLYFNAICKHCGTIYNYFIYDNIGKCKNASCTNSLVQGSNNGWNKQHKDINEIKLEIISYIENKLSREKIFNTIKKYFKNRSDLSKKLKFFSCAIDAIPFEFKNILYRFTIKSNMFTRFLDYNGFNEKVFYLKYLKEGENYIYCEICNKLVLFPFGKSRKNKFCSRKCYWNHKSKHPDLYYNVEANRKISDSMKNRIKSGEFTPCITNTWTHWTSIYNNNKFRSFYELIFHVINPTFLYEKIRIEYIKPNGVKGIYILDFVDEDNKFLFEVKPNTLTTNEIVKCKEKFAKKWANDNNYSFIFISEDYLFDKNKKDIILKKLTGDDNKENLIKYLKYYKKYNK